MPKRKTDESIVRPCNNIRSRKHPDQRCTYSATHGEFCSRHYKNPSRFQEKIQYKISNHSTQRNAAIKLQTWWKLYGGLHRFKCQGPATCIPAEAENQTDIYTLDSTSSIPFLYRWSYVDSRKHLWLFDIRSLSMTRAQEGDEAMLNPYTREPLDKKSESSYLDRCKWLRDRKYCLVHTLDLEMTLEQLWHQQILDVTMKYDVLGYHTCLNWFEELSVDQLSYFYKELWELWNYRLQLNDSIKSLVVPGWNAPDSPLFKWHPVETRTRFDKKWWQKTILEILNRFVSSAQLKEHKILGALYGMTAFAIVSYRVRQHYPWLVEMDD